MSVQALRRRTIVFYTFNAATKELEFVETSKTRPMTDLELEALIAAEKQKRVQPFCYQIKDRWLR